MVPQIQSNILCLLSKKKKILDCSDLNDLKSWWTCITVIQICIIIPLLTPLLEILIFRHLISALCSSWSSILKGLRLLALVKVGNHCSACNTSYNIFLQTQDTITCKSEICCFFKYLSVDLFLDFRLVQIQHCWEGPYRRRLPTRDQLWVAGNLQRPLDSDSEWW